MKVWKPSELNMICDDWEVVHDPDPVDTLKFYTEMIHLNRREEESDTRKLEDTGGKSCCF